MVSCHIGETNKEEKPSKDNATKKGAVTVTRSKYIYYKKTKKWAIKKAERMDSERARCCATKREQPAQNNEMGGATRKGKLKKGVDTVKGHPSDIER